MHVTKIRIENFKLFQSPFSLDLAPGLNILVGDNEVGKSTILEAIHLALTGMLCGRYLKHEITQSLFNNTAVATYLASLSTATPVAPPYILIEIHLAGDDLAFFEGNNNSATSKSCGLSLRIAFAEKYQPEYEALISTRTLQSLPIEYYEVTWRSFSRDDITARSIPIKSALIDSSSARFQNGPDTYVTRIVKDLLDPADVIQLTQAHRALRDSFGAEDAVRKVNAKIQSGAAITTKTVQLNTELSSLNSWGETLVTYIDDVPFHQIGKGEQSILKTRLALSHKKSKEANVLLIEEPENHLAHTKLNELVASIINDGGKRQILISTHSSFVANKLDLQHLILLTRSKSTRLTDLSEDTRRYFQRLPGYDTLRLLLCKKAILVEGPSDELIAQKAYMLHHSGHLPIQDGIDVISVGTAFLRFLEVARLLNLPISVITDNDGDVDALKAKYNAYVGERTTAGISIFYDSTIDVDPAATAESKINYNTLEPKLLKANSLAVLNKILGKAYKSERDLLVYMRNNKANCALAVFDSTESISFPQYIVDAIQ